MRSENWLRFAHNENMNSKKQKQSATFANADPPKASGRTAHGPEPERFKIDGYAKWEDAATVLVRKPRPPGGWPK